MATTLPSGPPKRFFGENSGSFRNEPANDADYRRAYCTCSGECCRRFHSDDYKLVGLYGIRRHFVLSSPKRTMSVMEYMKARSTATFTGDELQALFDDGSHADMEEDEGDKETLSHRRKESSVGSRRPHEDDSGCLSSKRSRSGSDRPLADAGPLSSPRGGGDSTPSGVETSRTNPVRDPWMPTPSEIQSRYGNTVAPSPYALYACSGIKYDDITKELDFDPSTGQRRVYYIGLFHELRWYRNRKTSRRNRVPEWQAICQSWGAFVDNFNSNPAGYRERVCLARKRYERFSKRPKIERLHWGAVEVDIPCTVPFGIVCEDCHPGSSAASGRNTQSRAPDEYSSHSSFTPFGGAGGGGLRTQSPFPGRHAYGSSAAPTYRDSGISSPTNTKQIRTLGPNLMTNNSLDDSASFPLCI
ncbi:unnamed protein product [Phytophthora fragariaefolia]|uniref:Unnamed protein product n=1 Tax=Phytophthora fragariaefolia TaxID=1490495 RepID=A0A9W7D548_9STRA|nr:unnamed protein product [Phytophthora fragariaefolia]